LRWIHNSLSKHQPLQLWKRPPWKGEQGHKEGNCLGKDITSDCCSDIPRGIWFNQSGEQDNRLKFWWKLGIKSDYSGYLNEENSS